MASVCIIAEIGVNHNGDFALAQRMILAARDAGADVVKFQTEKPEVITSQFAQKADYQKEATGSAENQLAMLKKLMLPYDDFKKLKKFCDDNGTVFATTPFGIPCLEFLAALDLPFMKIPSGEITNLPYLTEIGKIKKPVILSTGMSEINEISEAVKILKKNGAEEITLLHCNTQYPTPFADVNLRAMKTLQKTFGLPVGYSDHTQGMEVSVAAVALGATVIEKHFTLDNNMPGPDHKASMEPDAFAAMVKAIRNIELALGDGVKRVTPSEKGNIAIARKSIVAARPISKGEIFTEENITTKRPGTGISPMRWFEILGKNAPRNFAYDELVEVD
jgi:N,N'-diacetyllegionaminate synthase